MGGRWRFLPWVVVSFALATQTFAATRFGRFVGMLHHDGISRDQLAKIDFISSREEGNSVLLKAVVTLHFGDFKSGEYVAYHFDNVRFNLLTQTFVFDQADQPITLVGTLVGENEFRGQLRSVFAPGTSALIAWNDGRAVTPALPLIEPLWGEYRGKCDAYGSPKQDETILHLYTYRSNEGAVSVGNPFRPYRVVGLVGQSSAENCAFSTQKECVWGQIRSGAYNFFKKHLILYNTYRNLTCTTEPDGLQCGGCSRLRRVSRETAAPRTFAPPEAPSVLAGLPTSGPALTETDLEKIQGEYVGYVHHEYLDRYQPGRINLLTYQAAGDAGGDPTLRMSAVATLYFGDEESPEALSYRFKERAYPNPLVATQFVLSQMEADVDAVLQVTSIGKGVVKGIWYSQLFGRVGNFEFRKQGMPELPPTAKRMEVVSGGYENGDYELELLVGLGVSQPNTENPFSPLSLGGWLVMTNITPRRHFTGGSFDFYTGRFGLEVDNWVHVGQRDHRGRLSFQNSYRAVTTPMPRFGLNPLRFIQ